VYPHDGVDALDVLGSRVGVVAVEVFVGADIDCFAAVDDLAEFGGEFGISCVSGGPEGVAAESGDRIIVQVSDTCGVLLVHEIRMPSRSSTGLSE